MDATLQPWITALVGPILTLVVLMVWRFTDKTEAKIDALNKFLTDNLITINREMGELKGASHKHVPSE